MRYRLKLKTDATVEPLSVAELKLHLRVDHATEDTLIESLGKAARRWVERYISRSLVSQTWTMSLDGFPYGGCFKLPRGPHLSVESIKYRDEDSVQQTMSASKYKVDPAGCEEAARVMLADGEEWPDTDLDPNSVEVEFKAGYGTTAASVPDSIKAAMKLLVGHWFENREEVVTGTIATDIPMAAKALLGLEMEMEATDP